MRTFLGLTLAILFTCPIAVRAEDKVFFGILHSHTSYSDGKGTPVAAYDHARTVGLDFLALTEHNHSEAAGQDGISIAITPELYNGTGPNSLISIANAKTVAGEFVALYGQEYSSIAKGNHVNVLDVGELISSQAVPNGRFDTLLAFLSEKKDSTGQHPILMLNHPSDTLDILPREYGRDDFNGIQDFVKRMGEHSRLIQIINGPGLQAGDDNPPARPDEQAYLKFLNLGFMLAPTADQDNHNENWGSATPARTAIIAEELTKTALLDAIRKRHVYATEDRNLRAIMKINGHLCGDVLPVPAANTPLVISYDIADDGEPNAEYIIRVFGDLIGGNPAALMNSFDAVRDAGGKVRGVIDDEVFQDGPQYIFFKITQIDEDGEQDDVWTSPIWFRNDPAEIVASVDEGAGLTPPGMPDPGPVNLDRAVASKRSNSFHLSLECLDARRIRPENIVNGSAARQGRHLHPGCPRMTGQR